MNVKISSACYNKILQYTLAHANPRLNRREWKEVVGFLIGIITNSSIFITDVVMSTEGSLVYVVEEDYSKLPWDRIEQGEYLVGWVHSHPGHGLFLSGIDIQSQINYQKLHQKAVALVIDPTKITSSFSGIKAFRVNEQGDYYPVSLQISDITDFTKIYESILIPLEAELKDVLIQLCIPKEVLPESPFQVFIEYQHFPSGNDSQTNIEFFRSPLVCLSYSLHASNANLLTRSWGGIFKHEVRQFGTVAIIRLMSGKEGTGEVVLKDIRLGPKSDLLILQDQRKKFAIKGEDI
ncbi:MAG: Mov34/MPN/PAD-1 family protein [Candidatus Hodarchaeota archaeon]